MSGLQGMDFGNGLELLIGITFVITTESAFGKEIHREQNAQQERQEG